MKEIRAAQTSARTLPEALDDINERMLEKEGVGPESIISAQYERSKGAGTESVSVTVFFLAEKRENNGENIR